MLDGLSRAPKKFVLWWHRSATTERRKCVILHLVSTTFIRKMFENYYYHFSTISSFLRVQPSHSLMIWTACIVYIL